MPSWNRLSYRQRLSVHRSEPWGRPEGYRVADAMIEAHLFFPHSIGFSGGQLSSYAEGSSALDSPLIHDARSQDPP